jgi:hypothetical protein
LRKVADNGEARRIVFLYIGIFFALGSDVAGLYKQNLIEHAFLSVAANPGFFLLQTNLLLHLYLRPISARNSTLTPASLLLLFQAREVGLP